MAKLGRTYQLAVIASLAVAAVLAALALTDLGTTFSPGQRVHVAIQTCGAIVLCLAAFLVFERFHTDARFSRCEARARAPTACRRRPRSCAWPPRSDDAALLGHPGDLR